MKIKIVLVFSLLVLLSASCNPFQSTLPSGVVKSTNGGVDWQFTNAVKGSTTASIGGLSISKLAFEPNNNKILIASTYNDGMFKSEDSGASWTRLLSKIMVYDFVINPFDAKIIYAAGFCVNHGCVVKTTDGGGSWNEVYKEGSTTNPNPVRGVGINPKNPNQLVIGTLSGSVIKSADAGNTWQLVNNFADQVNRVLWQENNVYVLLKGKGLYSGSGFVENLSDITTSLSKTYSIGNLSYTQETIDNFSQVFVDSTSVLLIYVTTNKGVYKTVDGGKTWELKKLPIKPSDSATRAIAISKASSNIVFTSVASTIYKSLDGGTSWQTQNINSGGFVNYILIDPILPQVIYSGIYLNE